MSEKINKALLPKYRTFLTRTESWEEAKEPPVMKDKEYMEHYGLMQMVCTSIQNKVSFYWTFKLKETQNNP